MCTIDFFSLRFKDILGAPLKKKIFWV